MSYTPGPWHWEADPVKGDPYERVRYQVTAVGQTITRIYHSSFEGGPTNAEADARLIAAAPDMAEALRDLIDLAEEAMQQANIELGNYDIPEELRKARAALAKAGL